MPSFMFLTISTTTPTLKVWCKQWWWLLSRDNTLLKKIL